MKRLFAALFVSLSLSQAAFADADSLRAQKWAEIGRVQNKLVALEREKARIAAELETLKRDSRYVTACGTVVLEKESGNYLLVGERACEGSKQKELYSFGPTVPAALAGKQSSVPVVGENSSIPMGGARHCFRGFISFDPCEQGRSAEVDCKPSHGFEFSLGK